MLFRQPQISSYTAADLLHQNGTRPPKTHLHTPPPYPRPHQVTPAACFVRQILTMRNRNSNNNHAFQLMMSWGRAGQVLVSPKLSVLGISIRSLNAPQLFVPCYTAWPINKACMDPGNNADCLSRRHLAYMHLSDQTAGDTDMSVKHLFSVFQSVRDFAVIEASWSICLGLPRLQSFITK